MIRVASWNIWQYQVPWGYSPWRAVAPGRFRRGEEPGALESWLRRREVIVAELRASGADVVMLQECKGDPEVAPGLPNQAEQIAEALGYRCFYRALRQRGDRPARDMGLAILVRPDWPASVVMDPDLPWSEEHPKDTPRGALWARVATPGGMLDCVCTHLSLNQQARLRSVTILDRLLRVLSVKWRERGEEFQPLTLDELLATSDEAASAAARSNAPPLGMILGGDFNAQPHELAMRRLRRAWFRWPDEQAHARAVARSANWPDPWVDAWDELEPDDPGYTFPTPEPSLRFDYLFVHPVGRLRPASIRQLGTEAGAAGFYGSDHVGLVCELEIEGVGDRETRGQRAEGRGQETGTRGQRAEGRGQETGDAGRG